MKVFSHYQLLIFYLYLLHLVSVSSYYNFHMVILQILLGRCDKKQQKWDVRKNSQKLIIDNGSLEKFEHNPFSF